MYSSYDSIMLYDFEILVYVLILLKYNVNFTVWFVNFDQNFRCIN